MTPRGARSTRWSAAEARLRAVEGVAALQWARAPYRGHLGAPWGQAAPVPVPWIRVDAALELGVRPVDCTPEGVIELAPARAGQPVALWRNADCGWMFWSRGGLCEETLHRALRQGLVGADAVAEACFAAGPGVAAAAWLGPAGDMPPAPPALSGSPFAPREWDPIYPIVASVAAAQRWLDAGARLLQLRDKTGQTRKTPEAVRALAASARQAGAAFVVNDDGELARAAEADWLHLGFEDTGRTALGAASSRIRLGVSTHSALELASALGLAPGYVALGPIWETTTKQMRWQPQSPSAIAHWRAIVPPSIPLVAIGGIGLANAAAVREAGATSAAVVRALADSPEASSPEVTLHAWRAHWTG